MAVKVPVILNPVDTRKVDAAIARIQSAAKGVDFGGGARSLNKLSRPLGKITGQADEFQKSLEASNARVLAFGASVVVINKLSQAFGALVTNTVKVEASFAKINVILGGTRQEIEKFGDGIFRVAQKTATSFDEVAEGALELARQGLSVQETLSRVETALKLVRVAGVDSKEAVAGLTAAVKGFAGSGLTVATIADKLAEVDTKFAVSTEDLINGLERASASARVAGVSFDELLSVVTTVQERTQRGGAVIGNAFKTIFARLSRQDTLNTLKRLGISIEDQQGNLRGAIPLFQELAVKLDAIGIRSKEAAKVIQSVAGVRQRDILIALMEDMTASQSQFKNAVNVSAGAVGALDRKNAVLNDTLEAMINNLVVGGQKLAAVLGETGFTDAAKNLLKLFSSIVNSITDLLQGDGIGSKFAKGFVKGVGAILTGPGVALVGAIFIKLFTDLAKFGVQSLKSLLGINSATQQQKALQQSVLQTLLQNEALQRELIRLEGNKTAQEQVLLRVYNEQANAMARIAAISQKVSPAIFAAGFRGGAGGVGRTGRGADGFVAAEQRDVSRGVGGASPSSKVVSIPNFNFGGGKKGTMIANTSEYFVPNFGGGDAIFNKNQASGGLPAGAMKLRAAKGYKGTGTSKSPIFDDRFAMITPASNAGNMGTGKSASGKSYSFPLFGFNQAGKSSAKAKNDNALKSNVEKFGVGLARQQSKVISGGSPVSGKISKLGNAGSVASLAGVIFEAAVSGLLKSPQYDMGQTSTFDFVGTKARRNISKLYPSISPNARFIEAKIGGNTKIFNSMANKMEKYGAGNKSISKFARGELMGGKIKQPPGRFKGGLRGAVNLEFNRRGANGYIARGAAGSFSMLDSGKTLHGGAATAKARSMGFNTATNRAPSSSSAPSKSAASNMSGGGAFAAIMAVQTVAYGVSAALTEVEGPAQNVAQGLTSMLNGLMSAAFVMMAFTGPVGIAVGVLVGLTGAADGLMKTFNNGKGIVATLFGNVSDLNKQIKINTSLTESLRGGDLAQFSQQYELQMLGEQISSAENVSAKTGGQIALGRTKGFDIPSFAELQKNITRTLAVGTIDDNKVAQQIMFGSAGGPGMMPSSLVKSNVTRTKEEVISITEKDLEPFLKIIEALPSVQQIFEQYATQDIRSDENKSTEFKTKITNEINQVLTDGLSAAAKAFATDGITKEEKTKIQSNMLKGINTFAKDIGSPGSIASVPVMGKQSDLQQIMAGARESMKEMRKDSELIMENLGKSLPAQLSDGLTDAFMQALDGSKDLGDSLKSIANDFLQTIQKAFIQRAANNLTDTILNSAFGALGGGDGGVNTANLGGFIPRRYSVGGAVSGGGGMIDDVPALLTGGEFVMRRSAVEKYGRGTMEKINSGSVSSGSSVSSSSSSGGVQNNINLSFNISSSGGGDGGESSTRTSGKGDSETNFTKRIRQAVVTIVGEESRPGGGLYTR